MIFELAKNAIQEKIEAKTGFDGGKDASGKTRNYYSNNELIANKTVVSSLKNIYNDVDTKKIVASPIANSYDGLGAAFPDKNNTQWWPFGYVDTTNVLPELPNAVLGFAVASLFFPWQKENAAFKCLLLFTITSQMQLLPLSGNV